MFNGGSNNYFKAIKKLVQRFYYLILLITAILISINYKMLVENVVEDKQNIVSGTLALILTVSIFVIIAVPIMSIYTRRKCPSCGKYVIRYAHKCHNCGHELKKTIE